MYTQHSALVVFVSCGIRRRRHTVYTRFVIRAARHERIDNVTCRIILRNAVAPSGRKRQARSFPTNSWRLLIRTIN